MKSVIICKSIHHNNTRRIAEEMASELGADIITPEEANDEMLQQYDIIGFGSGIYMGKHHRRILSLVRDLDSLKDRDVFVFYSSGFEKFPAVASFDDALTKELEKQGAIIKGTFSCRGLNTWGPFRLGGGRSQGHPDDTDLDNARSFARSLRG